MNVKELQRALAALGYSVGAIDGHWGPLTRSATEAALTNTKAPELAPGDLIDAASRLGVPVGHVKAVILVEAPRGSFDKHGRPTMLYEPHVFARNSKGRFNRSHPALSYPKWKPGNYGPSAAQFGKLLQAVALDPGAAFAAVSLGMFQVLGENANWLGYKSAFDFARLSATGEPAQLDAFIRYIEKKGLKDELRACKPGDAASCVPFVRGYNGAGYAKNAYHIRLASALL